MAANRCPKCEFKYGWLGDYCYHCRHGVLTAAGWERVTEVEPCQRLNPPRTLEDIVLIAAGCLRRVEGVFVQVPLGPLLCRAEDFAAGVGAYSDLESAAHEFRSNALNVRPEPRDPAGEMLAYRTVVAALERLALVDDPGAANIGLTAFLRDLRRVQRAARSLTGDGVEAEELAQCDVYRDVVPFDPPAFRPAWRTGAVVGIADAIFDAREFGNMPILADAIEDACCTDERVIAHCRADQPHVRGCWVIERVRST